MPGKTTVIGDGFLDTTLQRLDGIIATYDKVLSDPHRPRTMQEAAGYLGVPLEKFTLITTFLNACDRESSSTSRFLMAVSDAASLLATGVVRDPKVTTYEAALAGMKDGIANLVRPCAGDGKDERSEFRNLDAVFKRHGQSMMLKGKNGEESLADVMGLYAEVMLQDHFDRSASSARAQFGTDYGAAVALAVMNMGRKECAPG